jgi:hypothetical protein
MERLDRGFKPLLLPYNLNYLETYSGAIYGVWKNFRLAYLNPGWYRFARENGGEPDISREWRLGRSILDGISADVKEFYAAKFKACLSSHTVWSHNCECSSHAIYRCCHQIVYPLSQQAGLLIVNSPVVEKVQGSVPVLENAADQSIYLDENGFFCQCAYCRRMKNFQDRERWDWIPAWVKRYPKNTSHSFCPSCFAHYFPTAAAKRA